jgi:hypothetical protein
MFISGDYLGARIQAASFLQASTPGDDDVFVMNADVGKYGHGLEARNTMEYPIQRTRLGISDLS